MTTVRVLALFGLLQLVCVNSAFADPFRVFESYHAFFVYADDGVDTETFKNDAEALRSMFNSFATPWQSRVYGALDGTSLLDAINDMRDLNVARPNEWIFFYYTGHGGGTDATTGQDQPVPGQPAFDMNQDESDVEDPTPPAYGHDVTDESLHYGPDADDFLLDDEFGDIMEMIQMQGAFVSGAIDSCFSNGMLDGSNDIRGLENRDSVWMTSATEWETSPVACASGFGTIVDRLSRDIPADVRNISDLQEWFRSGAAIGGFTSTIGVTTYDDLMGTKEYFPAQVPPVPINRSVVPEPSTLALLAGGLVALRLRAWRRGSGQRAEA